VERSFLTYSEGIEQESAGEPARTRNGGALMPFGGNDWLALTPEPPLEPGLPICDPHHHFWDFRTA
jgi:hypothetical protein